ncbi:MAG: hypothetical protein V3V05_03310 [Pontiella sp.]
MKKINLFLATAMAVSLVSAESILKPINDQGYGTISGRIQSLTMYRDFDSKGANGANSTLGIVLGYTSPEIAGFDAGITYNYAGEIYDNNASAILANDEVNILNEGWIRYNFGAVSFSNTTVMAGRKINNGEVFRADDFRQKARSLETVQLETSDLPSTRALVGHTGRMSNWIQAGDHWEFQNYGDVFSPIDSGINYNTDGVTWGEAVNNSIDKLEIALYDAYAWDIANLIGTRIQWDASDSTSLVGYYRNEMDVGHNDAHESNAFGLSLKQKLGAFSLEPGYFGVRGDDLLFQELTTGINHALGASMELCSCQFAGGSDTAYLKAVTKMKSTKTVLYALYNYTWHDKRPFDGQELNIIIKQPIVENLMIVYKGGIGYRSMKDGTPHTTDTDHRLFITYAF